MKLFRSVLALVLILCCGLSFAASGDKKTISSVDVLGTVTIGKDKVISQIKSRPNQLYIDAVISEDIKRIYELSYFEDISVDVKDAKAGYVDITFIVEEKPVIKKITFKGNNKIKTKRLKKLIDLEEGSFVDPLRLKETKDVIWGFYVKKGFPEVDIQTNLEVDKTTNKAEVIVKINEKGKMRIKDVFIRGNVVFSDRKVKKQLKTKSRWMFNAGLFKQSVLDDDVDRISDFYKSKGFSDIEVEVNVDINETTGRIAVTFNLEEGKRYLLGEITLTGVEEISESSVVRVMELRKGDIYSEQAVAEEIGRMTEVYFNEGYIFTQITPLSYVNPQNNLVDINFQVNESELIYVRMVDIRGNVRTKDKVVRRELRIKPGDKFKGDKIKKSKQNLDNLGYFEDVRFEPESVSSETEQNLVVNVKENKTGSFSFGGGYSSVDKFLGFVELRQRNFDWRNWPYFTGAGQDLALTLQAGSTVGNFNLSFTEPWLFDNPVWFGFDLFAKIHDRDSSTGYDYEEERKGLRLRLGKRLNDELKIGTSYKFEKIDISDVQDDASIELLNEVGSNNVSVGSIFVSYDNRDNVFVPTSGINTGLYFDVGGGPFGGDKNFTKLYAKISTYHKVFKKAVVELRLQAGAAEPFSSTNELPIYERFFAGGSSTIRGYHERKVGPIGATDYEPLGGQSMFVGNVELTQPLGKVLKVAAFFDTGNVWAKKGDFLSGKLYSSVGVGLRVKTPLGPISIDYGYPLDKEPGEDTKSGRVHFNMSKGF